MRITIEVVGDGRNEGKFLYDVIGRAQDFIPAIDMGEDTYGEDGLRPFEKEFNASAAGIATRIRVTYEPE